MSQPAVPSPAPHVFQSDTGAKALIAGTAAIAYRRDRIAPVLVNMSHVLSGAAMCSWDFVGQRYRMLSYPDFTVMVGLDCLKRKDFDMLSAMDLKVAVPVKGGPFDGHQVQINNEAWAVQITTEQDRFAFHYLNEEGRMVFDRYGNKQDFMEEMKRIEGRVHYEGPDTPTE